MKLSFMLIPVLLLLSGCAASVAPSLQMSRDTKIFIFDVPGNDLFGSSVVNKAISKRIIGNITDRLEKNHIPVTNDLSGNAANLKFDVRTTSGLQAAGFGLSGRNRIEIQYRVTLEGTNGRKLFVYDDKQSDTTVDDVCDRIVDKVTDMVLRYYVDLH